MLKIPWVSQKGTAKSRRKTPQALGTGRGRELRFLDTVFGAITLSFDDYRLGVMKEAVQDGGGESGIIVEDACPVFSHFQEMKPIT